MPFGHRFGRRPITHDDRMHSGAEVPLDDDGRVAVCRQEVGQRAEHRTAAKALALTKYRRCSRRQSDTIAIERLKSVNAALERCPLTIRIAKPRAHVGLRGACRQCGSASSIQRALRA